MVKNSFIGAADDPRQWSRNAQRHLLCIDNNLAATQVPWNLIAFHAQQAAEGALKAYLVSRGEVVVHAHELALLLDSCCRCDADLIQLRGDCHLLGRDADELRYPTNSPYVTEIEARRAAKAARRVVDAVVPLL